MGLKAAPEDQALLLELQQFDTRLQQLEHQVRSMPETVALAELTAQADTIRRALAEQTGAWEDAKAELGRIEGDVQVVNARVARDTERLASSSSVKDVAALEQELAALARRKDDLEEIQLVVMERVEEREAVLAESRAALAALDARVAEAAAARDEALAALQTEQQHTQANRATIAEKVPQALSDLYEKQRARYGVGASHLRRGLSSAAGVVLNATDLNVVRAAAPDDVLLCPESSAILVRTDDSGL